MSEMGFGRKPIKAICFLAAIIMAFCSLGIDTAHAKALTSQITVYTQNNYTASKWALAGYSGRNLKEAGCVLFAWAHAIQMLSDTKRGDDLLTELIGVCSDPNGNYNHVNCSHTKTGNYAYKAYAYLDHATKTYGITQSSVGKSRAALEKCFADNGVIILRGPSSGGGHVVMADSFRYDSTDAAYLHVIDSHPYSFHNSSAKLTYYNSKLQKYASSSYPQKGADYWIKWGDISDNSNFQIWYALKKTQSGSGNTTPSTVQVNGYEYMPEGNAMNATYLEQTGFFVRALPTNVTNGKLTIVSQNESIIRIDKINESTDNWYGVVFTPVGIGTACILINSQDGSNVNDSMLITVPNPPISDPGSLIVTASDIQADGTFTVNLSMKDNPGYASLALGFNLANNTGTLQQSSITGRIYGGNMSAGELAATWNTLYYEDNGELGTLTFAVDDPSKDTTLTIERLESFDMLGRENDIRIPNSILVKGYKAPVTPGQLTVSASDIQADGTFTVDLGITNNPGFSAMTIGYKIGNNSGGIKRADLIGMVADANTTVGDYVRIWKTTDIVGNGEFASITFAVDDPSKDTTISIQILEMVDAYGRKVPINVPGPIQVNGYKAPAPVYSAQLTASASAMQADGTFTVTLGLYRNSILGGMRLAYSFSGNQATINQQDCHATGIATGASVSAGDKISLASINPIAGNGDVLILSFTALDPKKDITVNFSCEKATDPNQERVLIDGISVSVAAANTRVPGDANEDGEADFVDAMLILQYDAGWPGIRLNLSNADVNRDGDVDFVDAMLILQYDAGWPGTVLR